MKQLEKEGTKAHLLHHGSQLPQHDPESLTSASRARLDGSLLSSSTLAALADDVLLESELGDLSLVEVGERNVDSVNKILSFARSLTTSSSGESSSSELKRAIIERKRGQLDCFEVEKRENKSLNVLLLLRTSERTNPRRPFLLLLLRWRVRPLQLGRTCDNERKRSRFDQLSSRGETSFREGKKDVHLSLLRVGEDLVAVW